MYIYLSESVKIYNTYERIILYYKKITTKYYLRKMKAEKKYFCYVMAVEHMKK